MKQLAIIVPGYNCEKYIRKCLDSIISQLSEGIDVIFVDDGSEDRTAQIVKSYSDNIIYVYQNNSGVSVARNAGLEAAEEYKYIMFVDSDDWLEDGCISLLLNEAKSADYVFCDWNEYKWYNGEQIKVLAKINSGFNQKTSIEDIKNHFFKSRSGGCPWGKIYNNDIIKKHDLCFVEGLSYAEDYLFNLSYLKYAENVKYIPKALYTYNCLTEGARSKFRKNLVDITIQVEKSKMSLYSNEVKNMILMEAGMIEQFAVASLNLYDKRFNDEDRKSERRKIKNFFRENNMSLYRILKSQARLKVKVICIFMLIC